MVISVSTQPEATIHTIAVASRQRIMILFRAITARAGTRRFRRLGAPHAHTKPPYKTGLLWRTLRAHNREAGGSRQKGIGRQTQAARGGTYKEGQRERRRRGGGTGGGEEQRERGRKGGQTEREQNKAGPDRAGRTRASRPPARGRRARSPGVVT